MQAREAGRWGATLIPLVDCRLPCLERKAWWGKWWGLLRVRSALDDPNRVPCPCQFRDTDAELVVQGAYWGLMPEADTGEEAGLDMGNLRTHCRSDTVSAKTAGSCGAKVYPHTFCSPCLGTVSWEHCLGPKAAWILKVPCTWASRSEWCPSPPSQAFLPPKLGPLSCLISHLVCFLHSNLSSTVIKMCTL